MAVALAECCFHPDHLLGAEVDLGVAAAVSAAISKNAGDTPASTTVALFNETQSRIVVSVARENEIALNDFLKPRNIPFQRLGTVGGDTLSIRVNDQNFSWPIAEIYDDWFNSIRNAIEDSQPLPDSV